MDRDREMRGERDVARDKEMREMRERERERERERARASE